MTVRSTRLGVASAAGGGGGVTANVFTVPADRTAIVKSIIVFVTANTAAGTTQLRLDVMLAGTTARTVWRADVGAGITGSQTSALTSWENGFLVLLETDVLRLTVPAGLTAQCYASGALLDGDPS